MTVEQARQYGAAFQVDDARSSAALLQHVGVAADSRNLAVLHRHRLPNGELRVHRDDLSVVQDEVGVGRPRARDEEKR